MKSDLTATSSSDVVERPLLLKAAERTLNGLSLSIQGREFGSGVESSGLGYETGVLAVVLNDGYSPILSTHQPVEVFAGVSSISHHIRAVLIEKEAVDAIRSLRK